MEYIYMIREFLKALYVKLDIYIVSAAKFLLTFLVLNNINTELGFLDKINDSAIVVLISLVCALLPWGVSAAMAALFILGHFYTLSLELAGVMLILFIVMFLLYLRFGTGDSVYILVTLLLLFINMPYTIPVFVGLTAGTVTAGIPVAFGIIMYYMMGFANANADFLGAGGTEEMLDRFKFIIDNAFQDKLMILMIVAFAVTVILVYAIRKLAIDYAWVIAIIFGVVIDIIILLIGKAMLAVDISTASLVLGSIITVVLMIILQIFIFAVDYRKKVNVQFEDEEYVYYVKAVPKIKYDFGKKSDKGAAKKKRKKQPVKAAVKKEQPDRMKKQPQHERPQPHAHKEHKQEAQEHARYENVHAKPFTKPGMTDNNLHEDKK